MPWIYSISRATIAERYQAIGRALQLLGRCQVVELNQAQKEAYMAEYPTGTYADLEDGVLLYITPKPTERP